MGSSTLPVASPHPLTCKSAASGGSLGQPERSSATAVAKWLPQARAPEMFGRRSLRQMALLHFVQYLQPIPFLLRQQELFLVLGHLPT